MRDQIIRKDCLKEQYTSTALSIKVSNNNNNKVALEWADFTKLETLFWLVSAPELITKNTSDCETQTFGGYWLFKLLVQE